MLHHARYLWIVMLLFVGLACQPEQMEQEDPMEQTDRVELTEVWTLADTLDRPESVVYDAAREVLYVSNIGGSPLEEDGNGYITQVSLEGEVLDAQWVTGLDAPKGLAIHDGMLYTADIDELVAIDIAAGTVAERYPAEGAEFLNDVTVDAEGTVYVSDSNTATVYRLQDGAFEPWLEGDQVLAPNGVHVVNGQLVIAASDTTAEDPGASRYLKVVDLGEETIEPLADRTPIGGLDAVEPDGRGGYFLSDWAGAVVMHFTPETGPVVLVEVSQGTADLDYVAESDMIYLPVMMSDRLIAYQVSWPNM